ncbi:hypothetical protein PPSIR1_05078 [Plesiocystis pacifica SIR-1]|uniref:Uncharacterized protein n=1 Tax=Plesiocystis pacifica SIR-1 TaxID=391625 RepID=A6FWY8_9BACT|nr:hypothetical protein PPSIR1_05078 [Plesiocystis pacifica SIR-1]
METKTNTKAGHGGDVKWGTTK